MRQLFVERLLRSVKYESIYLDEFDTAEICFIHYYVAVRALVTRIYAIFR